ncbi:S9 family peptidase [Dermatophilus congolensis]|uniref:S9 family peptidase n=1 Tax=Dermatophilus congolensis TaxID=1863 RepID=UPI001FBA7DC8|nr:S9 family peptidase [Dermatophilus congolensis]
MSALMPPCPVRGDRVRVVHGDAVADPYAWLADVEDARVIEHVEAENAYAESVMADLGPLRESIVSEIRSRTQETDMSVPVSYRGWWYFSRTVEGGQYGIACRVPDVDGERPEVGVETLPEEQVLLDGNVEAGDAEFFTVGSQVVSSSGELYAYLVDLTGDERFDLRIRRICDGQVVDDVVRGVGYGLVWSSDDRFVFYTRVDDAWRPCEVWRHEVGSSAENDVRVFVEEDERFWVGISDSSDERFLVISSGSKNTSETHLLELGDPCGDLRCVAPRIEGVEYDVEPAGDVMFVTHNANNADFEVAFAPVESSSREDWVRWLEPAKDERVVGVSAFARDVVVAVRSGGFTQLRVVRRLGVLDGAEAPAGQGSWLPGAWRSDPWQIPTDEVSHTIGLWSNPDYETSELLYSYETLVTPPSVVSLDFGSRQRVTLKTRPVLGGFDQADYVSRSVMAVAADGTQVPMSLVARADTPLDGTAPGVLYAYGAYEVSLDPWFSVPRLSLLDRGVVWAVAHVRGGGELGRSWYEQGRLCSKANTFSDVVACADALVEGGFVAPGRLALEGGSAGGLTVGAAVNLAPEKFAVVHAAVPFVDALNTILDPSLPLTVTEWEEWGNPLHDADVYSYMKAYTPYENVRPVRYPAVLATTSLNDTRVSLAEPAKWVARLREVTTNGQDRPILLVTEMVAGHGGRSGRYKAWEQYAREESFVLAQLGAIERVERV